MISETITSISYKPGKHKLLIDDIFLIFSIIIVWFAAGLISEIAAFIIIPATLIYLYSRKKYPEIIIGFFILLILADNLHYQLRFSNEIRSGYLLLMLVFILLDRKYFKVWNNIYVDFIPFIAIALISIYFDPSKLLSFEKTISYLLLLIIVPQYIINIYAKGKEIFLKEIILSLLIIYIIQLIGIFIFHDFVFSRVEGRFNGFFGNPNGLGIFTVLFYIMYRVTIHYHPSIFTKNMKFIIPAIIIITAVLTNSRTTIGALLLFILSEKFYQIIKVFAIFILIILKT